MLSRRCLYVAFGLVLCTSACPKSASQEDKAKVPSKLEQVQEKIGTAPRRQIDKAQLQIDQAEIKLEQKKQAAEQIKTTE